MLDNYSVLRRPIITEKSTNLQETNRYVFQVANSATKIDVKLAVEKNFNVKFSLNEIYDVKTVLDIKKHLRNHGVNFED